MTRDVKKELFLFKLNGGGGLLPFLVFEARWKDKKK